MKIAIKAESVLIVLARVINLSECVHRCRLIRRDSECFFKRFDSIVIALILPLLLLFIRRCRVRPIANRPTTTKVSTKVFSRERETKRENEKIKFAFFSRIFFVVTFFWRWRRCRCWLVSVSTRQFACRLQMLVQIHRFDLQDSSEIKTICKTEELNYLACLCWLHSFRLLSTN